MHTRRMPLDCYDARLRARRRPRGAMDRREPRPPSRGQCRASSTCRTSAATKARRRSGSSTDVETKFARRAWVAYIGDDITDEDAFRAIECGIGVLVGLRPTAATYKIDGIPDVDRFLTWLAAEVRVWTRVMTSAQLGASITDSLRGTRLIVVANREPYIHLRRRQSARGLWSWLRGQKEIEEHRLDAAGERPGDRARSGDARLRRHLDRARQRQRRSRNRRSVRARPGAAGSPVVHLAPGVADAGRRAGLLLRLRQ